MRFAITAAAIALGIGVIISVIVSGNKSVQPDPEAPETPAQVEAAAAPPSDPPADEAGPSEEPTAEQPPAPEGQADAGDSETPDTEPAPEGEPDVEPAPVEAEADALSNLRPRFAADPADPITIGNADPESGYQLRAEVDPYRAGLLRVALSQYTTAIDSEDRYELLSPIDLNIQPEDRNPLIGSYAARQITINGQAVTLYRKDAESGKYLGAWEVVSSDKDQVTLAMTIRGGPEDSPTDIARITRVYSVAPGSYSVSLDQSVENLSDLELTITWAQLGPGDVHHNPSDYLRGRSRQYVLGYFDDDRDQSRFSIYTDDGFISRPDLINKLKAPKSERDADDWDSIWPNPKINNDNKDKHLVWLAVENRYFAMITSASIPEGTEESADIVPLTDRFPTIATVVTPNEAQIKKADPDNRHVVMYLTSAPHTLKPGAKTPAAALDLDIFAGPRLDEVYAQSPYKAMRLDKTIRYSLGGFCGFCTFQWLAHGLLGFMELLHDGVWGIGFHDWGVSIILLVLAVRLILHPLTKRGQTNMMKMGKQMAAVQPELEKLKKKYKDDPKKVQAEQMRLFREKGINPAASAVGCLPMFLQMPIWIALYAMLYYAIELRQESAFYGVFQAISGGYWPFLGDLSVSDRFIPLFPDDGTHVLEVIFIRFDYSAINILPLLMGITFYFNMKLTSPPPANEQQAQQQKIMRFMPFLMPIFLYSAPSGLTLYICASTFAGIVDSYIVRKHVKELEASGELFKKKEPKPGGFMDKLGKMAEEAQKRQAEAAKQDGRGPGGQHKKRKRK